jgi:hypothetical protein
LIRITIRLLSGAFFLYGHLCVAQFSDNFSDGEYGNNPTWSGSAGFIINGSSQLQLNNSVAGTSSLSSSFVASSLDNFEWQVYVKQTFAPSGSNYGRVYLASNQTNLGGPLNGYYLQFGEAGSTDAVELFKQSGLVSTSVCRAMNGSIAASFNIRVRVLRSNTGLWRLMIDYTGGTNFVEEASGTDATYNSSAALGVVCVYTASNANKFFYDDFFMGPEIVDLVAPSIESVTALSATELQVNFNETLAAASALLLTNYSVNNGVGHPSTAMLQNANKTVKLTFTQPFPNAVTCQLTTSGVQDEFSNAMAMTNQNFLFFQPVTAESKDIVITEIFADPSPTVGLPEVEFVEIYNRSNKIFDLQNWKITDGSSVGPLPSHLFFPNQYVTLTLVSGMSQFASYGTVLGISNFPTLNNSGDHLSILDNTGLVIEEIYYTIDWYRDDDKKQGGYSLELIDPFNECAEENNWIASQAPTGGTPGTQNSVFANEIDLTGPKLISVIPISATEITLQFDEKLRDQSPNLTDFIITPSILISQLFFTDVSLKGLHITLTNALQPGIIYSITLQNIYDCPGNAIVGNAFDFGLPEVADGLDVAMNEIFSNPSPTRGLPEWEFIELYNRSNKIFNLKDWKITDGSSTGVLPSHLFFPHEYVILTSTSAAAQYSSFGTVLSVTNFPTLNNAGETLVLKDSSGTETNRVSFTDDWYRDDDKKQGGYSLELIDPANTCAEESNWVASEAVGGGTPGSQNSVFANKPDLTGPSVVSAIPTSATELIIRFDEKLHREPPAATDFTITPTVDVSQLHFTDESLKAIQLTLDSSLQPGVAYSITTQNIFDCPGNRSDINSFGFGLPEVADSLDLLINELLFNPRPTGQDFIEIKNNSTKFINLKNWSIANYLDGTLSGVCAITSENFLLAPGQYRAFSKDTDVIKGEYVIAVEENLFSVLSLPPLNDSDGTVALVDSLLNIIDFFAYADDYHSVFLDDEEGVSLERISLSNPTNDRANWTSASSTVGFATPGLVNSNVGGDHSAEEITITPEIFEPISGQPNFTQIHYRFQQGGSVANVKIVDAYGREIKQVLNNATLGTEGFFRWDGDTNEGTKARTGYYVVWVEVFNAKGMLRTYRRRVIIANSN